MTLYIGGQLVEEEYPKCYNTVVYGRCDTIYRFILLYTSTFERNYNQTIERQSVFFWTVAAVCDSALRASCGWSYAQSTDADDS